MAVLPILISGDPVLHTPAEPVKRITDEIRSLVADLFETMAEAPGVGLAAPQVGVAKRIFVYAWTDEDGVEHRGTAIDPELWTTPTPVGEADEDGESEGCLSFPGERFALRRAPHAILSATGLDGHRFEVRAKGWLARIFQHEYDHLDGILYLDRLTTAQQKIAAKAAKKNGWNVPGVSWQPGRDHPED